MKINIFVGPNPTALYHSIAAAATMLFTASPWVTTYYFISGTVFFLWRDRAEFVPIITEALVKPIFEVDKIDRTVSLDSQAVSKPEKHASAFRRDILDNVVQSLGLEEHIGVKSTA